jgi:hypothetical protein
LREIAELAVGADREARWLKSLGRHPAVIDRVACARVMARLASDVSAVVRVVGCAPTPLDEATRRSLADAIGAACETTATAMTDPSAEARHDLSSLRRWSSATESPVAWIAPAALLLLQDLRHLQKLATPVVDTKAKTP